jgi:hypothetical protein
VRALRVCSCWCAKQGAPPTHYCQVQHSSCNRCAMTEWCHSAARRSRIRRKACLMELWHSSLASVTTPADHRWSSSHALPTTLLQEMISTGSPCHSTALVMRYCCRSDRPGGQRSRWPPFKTCKSQCSRWGLGRQQGSDAAVLAAPRTACLLAAQGCNAPAISQLRHIVHLQSSPLLAYAIVRVCRLLVPPTPKAAMHPSSCAAHSPSSAGVQLTVTCRATVGARHCRSMPQDSRFPSPCAAR